MREIMQIISVLSDLYERDMIEFISTRDCHNKKCRAFRLLGYFCYEAYLNNETGLSLRAIAKFIHQQESEIINFHKYIFVRMRINALTGRDVKVISNVLEHWKSSPQLS